MQPCTLVYAAVYIGLFGCVHRSMPLGALIYAAVCIAVFSLVWGWVVKVDVVVFLSDVEKLVGGMADWPW